MLLALAVVFFCKKEFFGEKSQKISEQGQHKHADYCLEKSAHYKYSKFFIFSANTYEIFESKNVDLEHKKHVEAIASFFHFLTFQDKPIAPEHM